MPFSHRVTESPSPFQQSSQEFDMDYTPTPEHLHDMEVVSKALACWSRSHLGEWNEIDPTAHDDRHYTVMTRLIARETLHVPFTTYKFREASQYDESTWNRGVTSYPRTRYTPEHVADIDTVNRVVSGHAHRFSWCSTFENLVQRTNRSLHVKLAGRTTSSIVTIEVVIAPAPGVTQDEIRHRVLGNVRRWVGVSGLPSVMVRPGPVMAPREPGARGVGLRQMPENPEF